MYEVYHHLRMLLFPPATLLVSCIITWSFMVGIKVFADKYALEAESRRRALVQNQVPENIHLSKVLFSAEA